MKFKVISLIYVTLVLLCSCNNNNKILSKSEKVDLIIDVDPSKAIKSIQMSELFLDINYIPLETNENSLIGNVSDIIKYKDRFYILDNDITQSVFCFSETGRFIFKINKRGTGPGEYVKLAGFTLDTDREHLLLHDTSTKQVLRFGPDGEFIESHRIEFQAYRFSYISDGYFAFYCEYVPNNEFLNNGRYPNLIITDQDFNVYKTGLEFSKDANFPAIPNSMQCFSRHDSKSLSLITSLNDTIYNVSKDNVFPRIHFNFKNNQRKTELDVLMNTPESELEINAIVDFLKNHGICDLFLFVESTKKIFFAYAKYPATHFVFYDKETKEIHDIEAKRGARFPIINDIDGGDDFPIPMISDENLFYGIVSPDVLIEKKEDIRVSDTPKKQSMLELIDKISDDDNPIIAIISPK